MLAMIVNPFTVLYTESVLMRVGSSTYDANADVHKWLALFSHPYGTSLLYKLFWNTQKYKEMFFVYSKTALGPFS
jgi:hypothetical protein